MDIVIPGYKTLHLAHLVLDYNGTLALDGSIVEGLEPRLRELAGKLRIHVVTADTFGSAAEQLSGIDCRLVVLGAENQDTAKEEYVRQLGRDDTVAIGNGRNDRRMLEAAALGIAVLGGEGAAGEAISAADIVVADILSALDLLQNPLRLVATLRS